MEKIEIKGSILTNSPYTSNSNFGEINNSTQIKNYNEDTKTHYCVNMIKIERNTNTIKGFPKEARFVICKEIFNSLPQEKLLCDSEILEQLIRDLEIKDSSSFWIRDIPNKEFNEISKKLSNATYREALIKYFKELIEIIKLLRVLNIEYINDPESIIIRDVVNRLWNKGVTLGMTRGSLENTLGFIIDYLRKELENFILERIIKQKLYHDKDKRLKECSRCHRILAYKAFEEYKREKRKGLRSVCIECKSAQQLIKRYGNKAKIIINEFDGKCSKCGLGIVYLPALEFHHPEEKKFSWYHIMDKSYKHAVKILKKEKVIVLCKNCHELEQSKTYNSFQDLILRPDIFLLSSDKLNELIEKVYQDILNKIYISDIRLIHYLIKKRFVIEQLYNGQCIGCKEVTVYSNLPAFDFHHLEPEKIEEKSRWQTLKYLDSEDIIKALIEENCICLCSNCHRLLHTRFNELAYEVFSKSNILNMNKILSEVNKFFNNLFENISHFSFDLDKIEFSSPLKLSGFPRYETWKLRLLQIYYYTLARNLKKFRGVNFKDFYDVISDKNLYAFIYKFLDDGFVKIVKDSSTKFNLYQFTPYGLETIKNIEKKYPIEANELKEHILEFY